VKGERSCVSGRYQSEKGKRKREKLWIPPVADICFPKPSAFHRILLLASMSFFGTQKRCFFFDFFLFFDIYL
jgi:hypothetical protein